MDTHGGLLDDNLISAPGRQSLEPMPYEDLSQGRPRYGLPGQRVLIRGNA